MPVIVVGADSPLGSAVVDVLLPRGGEVRAFVTDIDTGRTLQSRGVKVAIGDVSDGSHVGGAALSAFCAVLAPEPTHDERERAFADTPAAVVAGWAEGLRDAGVRRAIWIDDGSVPEAAEVLRPTVAEFVAVAAADRSPEEVAAEVARFEAAGTVG